MSRQTNEATRRVMFRSPSAEGVPNQARRVVDRVIQEMEEYETSVSEANNSRLLGEEDSEEAEENEEDEEEDDEEEEGEDEGEEEEEGDAASATSSEVYDRDADPEGYATRLDELAGVLEMGQVEMNAMKWGPAMGKQRDAPTLSMTDFRALVNHHLTTTEWKYNPPADLFPPVPGRTGHGDGGFEGLLPVDIEGIHPIRVLGSEVIGHAIDTPSQV